MLSTGAPSTANGVGVAKELTMFRNSAGLACLRHFMVDNLCLPFLLVSSLMGWCVGLMTPKRVLFWPHPCPLRFSFPSPLD